MSKKIRQTVQNPQRIAYPGIYDRPDVIAAKAAAQVAPEDPSLKRLFNVTRDDLYEMGKGRKGNLPGTLPGVAGNPRGSEAASGVMNRRNEQRILDAMSEAEKHPHLVRGMDPWYVMDPMFQRMVELIGLESAKKEYTKMNTLMGMSSPGSEVLTEIPRGTAAYALQKQNRFDDFIRYAGMAEDKRGKKFPADIRNVPGHAYHRTAQAGPMEQYLTSNAMQMKSPKVPMYIEASGVPETGFQTATPVGDAHWSRAVGLADTRGKRMSKGKEITPGASVSNPEMAALAPWWRKKIAEKLGIESVPAQARLWGTMSPQTGVTTPIGAPKLELISRKIMETAHRLGISPESARDMVLRGQTYAGKAEGGKVKMAEGGMVGLSDFVGKKPQPSMDEMQAALTLRKGGNKVDMSSIGANEAPDLPVKMYAPPGPGQLPVGGVDMSDTPGQQFVPMDQQAQPGQQQPGQQPPQGPGAAPQAPQGAPQGADSNILQMTPQGQAMAAMTPSQNSQPPDQPDDQKPLQGMAEGGSPKPVYTHEVYDIKTKKVKGQYQSANAARRGVDYYDNQYGGYRHDYRQINKPPSEGMARGGSVNLALPRVQKKAGGGRMTTAQMSAELLNKMGVKHPAIKELTTLDDYHKTIGDQVQEQVGKMRNIQSGFNYKYNKGQHVFTKDSAAKNHPPYTIVARTLWGNHPMREPHPVNPLMGKPIKDPATGKVRRTPHEPGYRIKYSTKDGNEVETDIPEWAILGSVKMSQGGLAKGKR